MATPKDHLEYLWASGCTVGDRHECVVEFLAERRAAAGRHLRSWPDDYRLKDVGMSRLKAIEMVWSHLIGLPTAFEDISSGNHALVASGLTDLYEEAIERIARITGETPQEIAADLVIIR